MSTHRLLLPAAALALSAVMFAGVAAVSAASVRTSNSPQAIASYRAGVASVLNLFMPANIKIVDAGNDLTKVNWNKASSDAARAVTGIARSKSVLDHLAVPPRAKKVQSLFERAFARFLSGAKLIKSGAGKRNLTTLVSGQKTYQQGLVPLQQAIKLYDALK